MKRHSFVAAVLAACVAVPAVAFAHAHLVTATPSAGAQVAAPSELVISYTEALEPRLSTIEVTDAAGKRVDKADLHTTTPDGKTVAVSLIQLAPGDYAVAWHATSIDTHKTEGHFSFTVVK